MAEADKTAAEAAEAAARTDEIAQQTVRVVNDEIARIFSDESLAPEAKVLMLSNLVAKNPEIAAQLDKIESILDRLKLRHGANVEMMDPDLVETDRKTETNTEESKLFE